MLKILKSTLEAWPIYAVIGGVLTTLVVVFFEDRVSTIAKQEIAASVPVSTHFLQIKADIATLKNDGGDTEKEVGEIKVQLNRVEGKIDDLLLIMSQ